MAAQAIKCESSVPRWSEPTQIAGQLPSKEFVTVRFDKRFHIPVILLNDDPNNPRQTFVHYRSVFFFKAFVEHFYQSLTRDGSLAAM
jgi:hypothetical protein